MSQWQQIWQRLGRGQHVVVLGTVHVPRPPPSTLQLIGVDCGFEQGAGACLRRALSEAQGLAEQHLVPPKHGHVWELTQGVRRHLLGDPGHGAWLTRALETLGLVSDLTPRVVLVFRSLNEADPLSLDMLSALLDSPLGLPVPTLFCFDSKSPSGHADALLKLLRRVLPGDAIHDVSPQPSSAERSAEVGILEALPEATRTALRAAATIGARFESQTLAELLDQSEGAVLLHLQRARDAGLPLQDRGRGRFRMPATLVDELADSTLPSLAHAWHQKLLKMYGGPPAPVLHPPTTPASSATKAPTSSAPEKSAQHQTESRLPRRAVSQDAPHTSAAPRDLFEARSTARLDPGHEDAWRQALGELTSRPSAQLPRRDAVAVRGADPTRAASHAEASGDAAEAAERYLAAAERSVGTFAHAEALDQAKRARAFSTHIGDSERRHEVELRCLLVMARASWLAGAEVGDDSLSAALNLLEASRPLLGENTRPALVLEHGSLYASVCYDIGTADALERGLEQLTKTSQRLLALREPLLAAELLNDEAAIWLKLGDPVRAHYLLSRSREVFGKVVQSHPEAARELAQTEHMLARLVLHARARPGRERDAWQLGIEHALSALDAYHALGDRLQAARVQETLGRLETLLGRIDRAAEFLQQARTTQLELGDALGLARSTAALSDALARIGEVDQALRQLNESVALNVHKGSIAGLEFNQQALHQLMTMLPPSSTQQATTLESKLRRLLGPFSNKAQA